MTEVDAAEGTADRPGPPSTGDPVLDEALRELARATERDSLEQQVSAFDGVHRALQDRLADLQGT